VALGEDVACDFSDSLSTLADSFVATGQPVDVERWPNSLSDRSVAHVWLDGWSLFAVKAMLAASIHQRSTAACVLCEGRHRAKVQIEMECYSYTYRLVIQPEGEHPHDAMPDA